jgi:hypothetical protein
MRYILALFALLVMAGFSYAAPFMVCDPQATVTTYQLTGPGWVPTNVTAQADGSIKMDVASAVVGITSLTVKACRVDPVWGTQCSAAVPFSFTKPGTPLNPANVVLAP